MTEVLMCPHIMSSMFSNEDIEDLYVEADPREDEMKILRELKDRLPEKYRNVYELLYIRGLSQTNAAIVLEITQPSVSYYNTKIIELLKWYKDYPQLDEKLIEDNIKKLSKRDTQIFKLLLEHHRCKIVSQKVGVCYEHVLRVISANRKSNKFDKEFDDLIGYIKAIPRILTENNNG